MAGIGFELRKTLASQTLSAYFKAYMSALAYASGPWICTIFSLGAIVNMAGSFLPIVTVEQFTVTTVYVYAFSLLLTGPFQIITTRFISDRIYEKKEEEIAGAVVTSLSLVLVLSVIVSSVAAYFSDLPPALEFAAIILFSLVSSLWMIMSYISCLKNFKLITLGFSVGMLVSWAAALGLAKFAPHPLIGLMAGYAFGHFIIVLILLMASRSEFTGHWGLSSHFLSYLHKYPVLMIIGFLTNMAVWIDKFVIWYFKGEAVWGVFFFYPPYDIPAYLAYLTAIPSTAFFLIKVETEFSVYYDEFIQSLLYSPSVIITEKKDEMVKGLKDGLVQLMTFQGVITLTIILLAPSLLTFFHLKEFSSLLFRELIVAAYFHFTFLHVIIFLMYFDKQRTLFALLGGFVALSGGLTAVAACRGLDEYLALGYVAAAVASTVMAIYWLFSTIEDIDGDIIFSQPLLDGHGEVIEINNCSEDNSAGRVLFTNAQDTSDS